MRREEADSLQFAATYKALAEVAEILDDFDGAVIAGGTVPFLLVPQEEEPHEGTVDIDVVLDAVNLRGGSELTLHEILERRLFAQDTRRPYRYSKAIQIEGQSREVLIELLGGGTPPAGGLRRIAHEDVWVSVIEGMEIALIDPIATSVATDCSVRVASISGFCAMKAVGLERREDAKKAKDAYDIVYCLRNYTGGVDAIAHEILKRLPQPILENAIRLLTAQFASQYALGPNAYAQRATSEELGASMRREAFEYVNDLLDRLP
ncbi:MAG TPA: nucleotidyl transferase AbiEii/AbiGii toxin family protein [Fimbriimonadaceae bacterium]|jgi:hypothetical protein